MIRTRALAVAMSISTAVLALSTGPAKAATSCDVGDDVGPVAVSTLSRSDQRAARKVDDNANGLVCGQTYYNARSGKPIGVHWTDDIS